MLKDTQVIDNIKLFFSKVYSQKFVLQETPEENVNITNFRFPMDEQILTWDPENMQGYWQQCHQFDHYHLNFCESLILSDTDSHKAFQIFELNHWCE